MVTRVWKEPVLINPALTPELIGMGQRVNGDGNPVLWALTWCCWAVLTREGSMTQWVCTECHDTIRNRDPELTAGFEVKGLHVLEGYVRAQVWVSRWTGVPADRVVVSVEWGRP